MRRLLLALVTAAVLLLPGCMKQYPTVDRLFPGDTGWIVVREITGIDEKHWVVFYCTAKVEPYKCEEVRRFTDRPAAMDLKSFDLSGSGGLQ